MDRVEFTINGNTYSVGPEISSDVTLLDYIRNVLQLKGTKYMCRQAGCGACVVAAARRAADAPVAVNSCMVSITSCKGWEVTTIEQLGNRKNGYHILQKTLAEHNGTQCGYCSPGWIMSMYCLLHKQKDLTMLEIEKSFASNICRCTGYRPILEAFKTFAKDSPNKTDILDIEDLKICDKTGKVCKRTCLDDDDWCIIDPDDVRNDKLIAIMLTDGRKWYNVEAVADIFYVLKTEGTDSYMLVAGNTAKGAYPILEFPRVLIDINGIQALKGFILDQNLVVGAGNSLTELLSIFDKICNRRGFEYLKELHKHLQFVAHIAVRNIGTIGGNLMLKHQHNDFPSDLFLMFDTIGAELTIINSEMSKTTLSIEQFLSCSMKNAVILNVKLPPLGDRCRVLTYKIMPRSQNAHAIVNFGALYCFNSTQDMLLSCRLAFGGLSPRFTRAVNSESFLIGKQLFSNETLQTTIRILENELFVTENPPEPSAAYRKRLAIGLFYKSQLAICPTNIIDKRYLSGITNLYELRPVSQAQQDFETKPPLWPLTRPIPKTESLIQCAGEAFFTEDLPVFDNEVYAELVLSTVGKGYIGSIDSTQALQYPNVIAFYTAQDIPGSNNYSPTFDPFYKTEEEVFSSGEIKYFNQPIGVIVAKTRYIAEVASKLVKITYRNVSKPIIDVRKASKDPKRNKLAKKVDATENGNDIATVVKGRHSTQGQSHFTMETIVCVSQPTEEGLSLYVTTQFMDGVQNMVAQVLNMDVSSIDVHVRRIGGGFGLKISRSILASVVCSLVTTKLNRPCRIIHSYSTVNRAFGKRFPACNEYEFAVNKNGVIQRADHRLYEDNGYDMNENLIQFAIELYNNCYNKKRWNFKAYNTFTDTAVNTWCRSPGTLEAIAFLEFTMEHISYALSLDPVQVRFTNLDPQYYQDLKAMSDFLLKESNHTERRQNVNRYNKENRWKKRGLRFVNIRWNHNIGRHFAVNLSVYHNDGSVVITHNGIEMGQGVNTKAAQICAYFLNIPLEKIQIKESNTIYCPNGAADGGSLTSQNIGLGVERCCKEILKKLEPIRAKMNNPSWVDLIREAFTSGVDLQSHGFAGPDDIFDYTVYGICLAEVEIDVLTGEMQVLRVDLIEDAGQSVNPEINVGQIEGGFIMGLGYWTSEKLVYSGDGELLTDRPWNYYVPQALDIPQDFRVYLRKNSYSTPAILGSKIVGEPPTCLSVVIPIAIREAVVSARSDSGVPSTTWIPFDGPSTTETICMSTSTRFDEFKFN